MDCKTCLAFSINHLHAYAVKHDNMRARMSIRNGLLPLLLTLRLQKMNS